MKKMLSIGAATLLIVGMTVGAADAKHRRSHSMSMTKGSAGAGSSANSMGGKNSPASSQKGSASPAGGGEK
jgi:hypothetical protein